MILKDNDVALSFEGEADISHVMLLGTGIESPVKGGGNANRLLSHDFVVLDYQRESAKDKQWLFRIKPDREVTAVAAWVSS